MEFENGIAQKVDLHDDILPPNISPTNNKVAHIVWDNFDVNEETPSGHGTTHTTHGIIVQDQMDPTLASKSDALSIERTRKAYKIKPTVLPLAHVKKRSEPVVNERTCASDLTLSSHSKQYSNDLMWVVCRTSYNSNATIPEWNGSVSATSTLAKEDKQQQSVIGYMRSVLHPITNYDTVHHCMLTSLEVSCRLSQSYSFVTMDLAAAKLAYDIVWTSPEEGHCSPWSLSYHVLLPWCIRENGDSQWF